MAPYEIRVIGDPVLKQRADDITDIDGFHQRVAHNRKSFALRRDHKLKQRHENADQQSNQHRPPRSRRPPS